MFIKLKKKKDEDVKDKVYEFRFYKYLILILSILFSCIMTISNFTSTEQVKQMIADEIRCQYSDFFEYEIENNDDSLGDIYDRYSSNTGIEVYKLVAMNVVYFGQDENRYLDPYMRTYIKDRSLSKRDKIALYNKVNKEVKKIENKYIIKIMIKRFSPYILGIIFVTSIIWGVSWVRKLNQKKKLLCSVLVFCMGFYISYISIYNLGTGLIISGVISVAVFEFFNNIDYKAIRKFSFVFLFLLLGMIIFSNNEKSIGGIYNHNINNISIVNELREFNYAENINRSQRIGESLFAELKKENFIEINESDEYIDNVMKSDKKIIFLDKKSNNAVCNMYFYKDIPIYRVVCFEGNSSRKLYEGVLNPYMRSMLIKLSGESRHRGKGRINYN